jgi:nucleotide-binding universal stress UspA family protein
MRVLVWIVEETWKAPVTAAAALLPTDADVTLLHVSASDAGAVARGAHFGLLGRSRRPTDESLDTISEESARELLTDAQTALGREATLDARSGRIEHEVLAAAETADVLVLARDRDTANPGPRSLGHTVRHVVDNAPCAVLVVWPDTHSMNTSASQ